MKRWLAFVLICVFFINILPFQAAAAEDEFVYISVIHNGHEKTYRVIKAGAQLLFAGEDLASFGGYTYRVEGDNAYFTRGMKTIRVNMARSSLIPYDGTTYSKNQKNITLKTAVCNVDGTNYFPGTQLLPWLSVNCSVEAGKLKITSDEITIWELLKEFDPDDYTFDFAKCCEELGEKSKWVKAWAGLQGLGFDAILGWLPSLGGNSKEEHNYYDIFEDMLQDQTCSESSLDELMDDTDKFNQWMEWIEIIGMEEELPDELRAMGAIFKVVGSAPAQLSSELGFYLTTMDQDNEDKLNALKYIVLQGSGFPESMDAAAQTIIVEYEDRILGILGKGIDILMDGLKDLMGDMGGDIFKIVLKFIDLPELVSVECSEGIRRVEFYDTIAKGSATAYKEERDKLSDTAVSSMGIQDARSMAYLYLYASEQNWRAMYEYAMYQEKYELANEYALCADAAEEMAAKFLASAYAQLNDSPKYGDAEVQRKQEYTDQLKEMFANISFYSSQADMLFDETYWVWTTGETAGSRYVVLFHKDGTMEYCSATNQGYGVMSYTYDNDLLTVNGADYRWDGEYFLSTEKMESQDPNGIQTVLCGVRFWKKFLMHEHRSLEKWSKRRTLIRDLHRLSNIRLEAESYMISSMMQMDCLLRSLKPDTGLIRVNICLIP